MKNQIAT